MTKVTDLEPSICSLADAANVCCIVMEHYQSQVSDFKRLDPSWTPKQVMEHLDDTFEALIYCVYELRSLSKEMREKYYASLNEAA